MMFVLSSGLRADIAFSMQGRQSIMIDSCVFHHLDVNPLRLISFQWASRGLSPPTLSLVAEVTKSTRRGPSSAMVGGKRHHPAEDQGFSIEAVGNYRPPEWAQG